MGQQAINPTLTESVFLEATSCCSCGVAFAIPSTMLAKLRDNHKGFYCPNGHSLAFNGKTEAQRLRDQLADTRMVLEASRAEAERIGRSNIALRGVVKRSKNRALAAICPVGGCRRHFTNLERHMGTKHPGFQQQDIT